MPYEIQRYNPHAETYSLRHVPMELQLAAPFPIGTPFLIHTETGAIPREPLAFSLGICDVEARKETGRFPIETALTNMQPIKGWYELLEAEGVHFRHADDEMLDLWLSDAIDYVIPRKGKRYEKGTLTQYVGSIINCYKKTNQLGLTDVSLDPDAAFAKAWGVDSIYGPDGKRRDLHGETRRYMVRTLGEGVWNKASGSLLHPRDWHEKCGRSSRPWVGLHLGLYGGYRVVETTGVWVEDVMRITVTDPRVEYEFPLRRTKGASGRSTVLRGKVIRDAQDYANGERAACVARAKKLFGSCYEEPPQLLVNGMASGKWIGRAADVSSMQGDLRRALEMHGFYEDVDGFDECGRPCKYRLFDHCFHDLRHTYALAHYRIEYLRTRDHSLAMELVQIRLGHAHRSTTEKIYLFPDRRLVAKVGDVMVRRIGALAHA